MVSRKQKLLVFLGASVVCYPAFTNMIVPLYRCKIQRPRRTVIITGATGNLGASMTYHMALRKMRTIMACRDMDKCKSLRREIVLASGFNGIACRQLDLEDIDSINKFADHIIATEPHVDVLINNAAVKNVRHKELTKYGIEKNYFVNFLGPMLLTFRLMDLLQKSANSTYDSRVVNVIGKPKKSWNVDLDDINFEKRKYSAKKAYEQSKLALAYFTILLNKFNREQKNRIYVYGTNPVASLIAPSFARPTTFWNQMKYHFFTHFYYNPDHCVSPTTKCATSEELAEPEMSGLLYGLFLISYWGWGIADKDEKKAMMVWNSAINMLEKAGDSSGSSKSLQSNITTTNASHKQE